MTISIIDNNVDQRELYTGVSHNCQSLFSYYGLKLKKWKPCDPPIHSRVYILEGSGPWAPADWPCTNSIVMIAKNENLETTQISSAEEWIHTLCFIHDRMLHSSEKEGTVVYTMGTILGTSHWGEKGRRQKDTHKITQLHKVRKHAN